jgi:hypothetical protein
MASLFLLSWNAGLGSGWNASSAGKENFAGWHQATPFSFEAIRATSRFNWGNEAASEPNRGDI